MISKLRLVALALVAAAVAAPIAQATDDTLVSRASQKAATRQTVAGDVGLARSLLERFGLAPAQAVAWTTGVCSYQVKPASCYLTAAEAKLASQRLAETLGARSRPPASNVQVVPPRGFHWGDAAIGAAVAAGLLLIGAAGTLGIKRRRELAHG
jgi:LPXTG-motif cell wall-anchored protein